MSDYGTGLNRVPTHARALIEAIRMAGLSQRAAFGLPELPGDDYRLDMAGRPPSRHTTKDHHQLAGARRTGPQPLPPPATILVPAVLARKGDHVVADQRACGSPADNVRLRPNRDAPGNAVSDFGSEAGAASRPQMRSDTVNVVAPNGVNSPYAAYQRPYSSGRGVRDEEAAGSNPATRPAQKAYDPTNPPPAGAE